VEDVRHKKHPCQVFASKREKVFLRWIEKKSLGLKRKEIRFRRIFFTQTPSELIQRPFLLIDLL